MIVTWVYNELDESIGPLDTEVSMRFPRPAAASDLFFMVGDELMASDTWGAYTQFQPVSVTSVRRGLTGSPKPHSAKSPVWVRHDTGSLSNALESRIGRYKVSYLDESPSVTNPIISVRYRITYNSGPVLVHQSFTTSSPTQDGVYWDGPEFTVGWANDDVIVTAVVTRASGSDTSTDHTIAGLTQGIFALLDGEQSSYKYSPAEAFAAPTVGKDGTVYDVLPNLETDPAGTADDSMLYFKVWGLINLGGEAITNIILWVDATPFFFGTEVSLNTSVRAGVPVDTSADLTLSLDQGGSILIDIGPFAVTAEAPSTISDVDQIQVEAESSAGDWFRRLLLDWTSYSGGTLEFASLGPPAETFRFRYRYRTFRRDGVEDETGIPQVISSWSAWSSLT